MSQAQRTGACIHTGTAFQTSPTFRNHRLSKRLRVKERRSRLEWIPEAQVAASSTGSQAELYQ